MYLNMPFIIKSLSHEGSWKSGDSVSFSFEGFNENAYVPNKYKSLTDIVEHFPAKRTQNDAYSKNYSMDLKQFLSYFDFDYDIVPPGGKYENRIRQELVEDKKLTDEEAGKDLICLIDYQGAYLGDIGKERFPVTHQSIEKIIDRLNTYILEFEVEFQEALEERGIYTDSLSLQDMIFECKAFGVGDGEVCYSLAEAVTSPESIYIKEVLEQEKTNNKDKQSLYDKIQSASNRAAEISSSDDFHSKESQLQR